tara:strand:- start:372 stop:599 length:228 start_codon:yes stop_codon:yes gene_type:complete
MTFHSNIDNKGTGTQLLSSEQVANKLGVSSKSLYRWMEQGKFPQSVRLGHMHRWRISDIEQWIKEGGTDAQREAT